MLFADPKSRHIVVVLANAGGSAAADDIIAASSPQTVIDVFCEPAGDTANDPRVHWHAPCANLAQALSALSTPGAAHPGRIVAWAVAGTRVPHGWDALLVEALAADDAIGSASPLCPQDALFSPYEERLSEHFDDDALATRLLALGPVAPLQMPAPLACCGALSARAVAALASSSAPGAWPLALTAAGLAHVACPRLSVHPPKGFKEGAAAPWTQGVDAACANGATLLGLHGLGHSHPLHAVRWRLQNDPALSPAAKVPASPAPTHTPRRPVRLHLSHGWGGGLGAWVHDFTGADTARDSLVLRPVGNYGAFAQQLALYGSADAVTPLRAWELAQPIHATATAHLQSRAILREITADFGVDEIVVSSLIGQSLDALRTGLPTVIVAHDTSPFCPALYAHFGSECRQCDGARLRECLKTNGAHRFFTGVAPNDWLALRRAFVDTIVTHDLPIVTPSPSTAARWQALMPELGAQRFTVIAHGIDLPAAEPFEPPSQGRLRLVKLGRITEEKGARILQAALPELLTFADLTLIGCGEQAAEFSAHTGVTTIPSFQRADLPRLVAQARPHLGLQLSTVPETFSYTLSELWHCGVPVLATRTGSLADRVREAENGFLCEPDAGALVTRLRELDARRAELAAIGARLRTAPGRDCVAMVADYDRLIARRFPERGRAPAAPVAPFAVASTGTRVRIGALSVDPNASYRQALRSFVGFTLHKAAASPRVPRALRTLIGGWLVRRQQGRS